MINWYTSSYGEDRHACHSYVLRLGDLTIGIDVINFKGDYIIRFKRELLYDVVYTTIEEAKKVALKKIYFSLLLIKTDSIKSIADIEQEFGLDKLPK